MCERGLWNEETGAELRLTTSTVGERQISQALPPAHHPCSDITLHDDQYPSTETEKYLR